MIRFPSVTTYRFHVNTDATIKAGSLSGTVLLKGLVTLGEDATASDGDMAYYLVRVARSGTFGLDRVHESKKGRRSVLVADEHIGWSQSIDEELESELFKAICEDFGEIPSTEAEEAEERHDD